MEIKWDKLEELAINNFEDVPRNSAGIYCVRWSKDGSPVPIGRLTGTDNKGLLYVGCAKKLRRRVRALWKGINKKGRHTIGKTIIFCKVFETINPSEYEIAWEELETREDAIGQESASISLYAQKYREPPPFNLKIGREMFLTVGIGGVGKSRVWYEPDEFVSSIFDEHESIHKQ